MIVKRLSLTYRLLFASSLVLTAFLGVSAFSLNNAFEASAVAAQQKRLQNYIYTLLTAAELNPDGKLQMPDELAEPQFLIPNSGLYAQITNGEKVIWQSPSALGLFITLPEHPAPSIRQFNTLKLDNGVTLLNLSFGTVWEDNDRKEHQYTFNVAEDLSALHQQTANFQRSLWYWLGGTGLLLLIVQVLILRWGLRPLHDVAEDLTAIETGEKKLLSQDYPVELSNLTQNINTLLSYEQLRRERYKNSLADLAHSLKTPLAVMRGELEANTDLSSLKITTNEQLERITALVEYQLQRAATEGQNTLLAPVAVGNIVHKILASLDKVYQSKAIHRQCEISQDPQIHADEGDIYELLGNLLENAYKYCNHQVNVFVQSRKGMIEVSIEDDGNGIPENAKLDILKRGKRADTQVEGHGIGLAIASDIIEAYQGEISIENGRLGGAKVLIKLPQNQIGT